MSNPPPSLVRQASAIVARRAVKFLNINIVGHIVLGALEIGLAFVDPGTCNFVTSKWTSNITPFGFLIVCGVIDILFAMCLVIAFKCADFAYFINVKSLIWVIQFFSLVWFITGMFVLFDQNWTCASSGNVTAITAIVAWCITLWSCLFLQTKELKKEFENHLTPSQVFPPAASDQNHAVSIHSGNANENRTLNNSESEPLRGDNAQRAATTTTQPPSYYSTPIEVPSHGAPSYNVPSYTNYQPVMHSYDPHTNTFTSSSSKE